MERKKLIYKVADYTEYPGPRYKSQGDCSGEDFYENVLKSKFREASESDSILVVNLDDTAGYASSFLDEAFGNLIYDYSKAVVSEYLEIISTQEPDWTEMILNDVYSDWEKRRIEGMKPKKTNEKR